MFASRKDGLFKRAPIFTLACLAATAFGMAAATAPADAQMAIQGAVTPEEPERFTTLDRTNRLAPSAEFARLRAVAGRSGRARVIVGLRVSFTPEGAMSDTRAASQRRAIAAATAQVRQALSGTLHRVIHTYETVPYIALELSAGALSRLEASRLAATLQDDTADPPTLAQSTVIVEAKEAASVGRDGTGRVVAILDTGVDNAHPFLQKAAGGTKVVSGACFSDNNNCPNGQKQQLTVAGSVPCTYAPDGCRHGTHVAGIAAGRGGPGTGVTFNGVAPGANLLAIQVFSRFDGPAECGAPPREDPCTKSFVSDQIKGLERVFALRNSLAIASANMSLGGGQFTAACNGNSRKAIIDNLRAAKIATVIASGNDGFANAVNSPGCISTAVTVGATDKDDVVALFSNSNSLVDLFAPGVQIRSSVPFGPPNFANFDGTSMATPHVAGAWAIARQVSPASTVLQVQQAFEQTGKPITDTLANPQITRDRIRVFSAAAQLAHTGMRITESFGPLAGLGIASDGVGVARRTNANPNPVTAPPARAFNLTGIPAGAIVHRAFIVYQTLGGPDPNFTFKGTARVATLVGGSGQFTCWGTPGTNNGGAYRTYLFEVPAGQVPGNGNYNIGGIGGANNAISGRPDGQGASLVVVYRDPGSPDLGRAVLRFGGLTTRPGGPAMTFNFTGLTVPAGAFNRALHVGIGDGEEFAEPAMKFAGTNISAVNFWSGKEGDHWDDDRLTVSAAQLPTGVAARAVSQGATAECLTWGYAGLTYLN